MIDGLCRLDAIEDGGAKGIELAPDRPGVVLLRAGDRVHGYWNHCPHCGGPLDLAPDRFLDESGRLLVCATHGALFRIEDGLCVSGPCIGASLMPVAVAVEGGVVRLA